MMRTGILTFQNTLNFGAALQNYALFLTLDRMAYSPIVVDYRSDRIEENECLKFSFRPRAALRYFLLRRKAALFNTFKKKLLFTKPCGSSDVAEICAALDYVVVGSDQVWNTKLTDSDTVYFLDFIDDPKKCKTYAASMGYGELPPCEFDVHPLISHFSSILVREKSAADNIARECPDAPTPHVVLDPTLLVEKETWDQLAQAPKYAKNKPYVLVYDVSESDAAFLAAHYLADRTGAKIIRILSYNLRPKKGVRSVLNVSPEQYLGLFAHAQSTIVSSFHGLCFSIINRRDFYFSGQAQGKNTNSRATDLMESLGISGRTVQDLFDGTVEPIDWGKVESRLKSLRAESLQLFKRSLEDAGER